MMDVPESDYSETVEEVIAPMAIDAVIVEARTKLRNSTSIEDARIVVQTARSITILTGAGISAESGIPTYRDENGLWSKYKAEDFSSVDAFARDPQTVWDWYRDRRIVMGDAKPNAGHLALAAIEQQSLQCTLFTQNIDGLHQQAGSRYVTEMHGSAWKLRCTECLEEWTDMGSLPDLPRCSHCRGLARPAVVWFGEKLSQKSMGDAMRAMRCDVLLVVGTSGLVNPVASLIPLARQYKAQIIEVNLAETEVTQYADFSLFGKASEILPQLAEPGQHGVVLQADMGRAFERAMNKFFAKYPELKRKPTDEMVDTNQPSMLK